VSALDEYDKATARCAQLLPAWFVPRMMTDVWSFALLTANRQAILIDHINRISQAADGGLWLDVQLLDSAGGWEENLRQMGLHIITAPTTRTSASVNAAHIVAAFEIADT
jgi:hypothetical protein